MSYYKDTANGVRNIINIFESIKEARLLDLNKERLVRFGGQTKTYDSPGKRRRTGVSEGLSLSLSSPSTPRTRRGGRGLRQGREGGRNTPTPPPARRDTHQSAPPPTPPPAGVGGLPAGPAATTWTTIPWEQGGMALRVCKASSKEDQGHLQNCGGQGQWGEEWHGGRQDQGVRVQAGALLQR